MFFINFIIQFMFMRLIHVGGRVRLVFPVLPFNPIPDEILYTLQFESDVLDAVRTKNIKPILDYIDDCDQAELAILLTSDKPEKEKLELVKTFLGDTF